MYVRLLILLNAFAGIASAGEVTVRPKSQVDRPFITLGDIADIEGFRPIERAHLSTIQLGRAPIVGQRRIIPKAFLRARINRELPAGSILKLGRQTEVLRRHQVIPGSEIQAAITQAVEQRIGDEMTDVAKLGVPHQNRLRVPEGARFEVRFENRRNQLGALNVSVMIIDGPEEKLARRVVVSVDRFTEVVTLNRDGKRGSHVRSTDLTMNRVAESSVPRGAIINVENAIGAILKRTVRRGDTLRSNWLDIPPVVLRGQRVRLIAKRGSIRVSTMGETLSKGRSQELIRVRNLSSKKIITGRVTSDGNVEMEF